MADTITTILETVCTFDDSQINRGLSRVADLADRAGASLMRGLTAAAMAAGDGMATMARAAASFRGSFPKDSLEAFAASLQNVTAVADDQVASMLSLLGAYSLTAEQAKAMALPILNTAEALKEAGVTTESLARQIGEAMSSGDLGRLDRSLGVDEAAFKLNRFGAIMDALKARGGDAATEFRQTLPGAIKAATNAFGDLQEALGAPLVGPLTSLAHMAESVAKWFTSLPDGVKTTATVIGVTLVGALGAASIAMKLLTADTIRLWHAQLLLQGGGGGGAAAGVGSGIVGGVRAAGAGLLTRVGGVGGLIRGGGVMAAGQLAGHAMGGTGGAAVQGMGIGAGIGMMWGPIGAAVGAAVGGIAGGLYDMQARRGEAATAAAMGGTKANPELEELKKLVTLQENQIRLLQGWQSAPLDISGTDVRLPEGAMARAIRRQVEW